MPLSRLAPKPASPRASRKSSKRKATATQKVTRPAPTEPIPTEPASDDPSDTADAATFITIVACSMAFVAVAGVTWLYQIRKKTEE